MNITEVLVVDDDVAVCQIVHRMLSNEHCKVQTSQTVAHALGAIEQKAFDAYVIDFKLPDGSGLDVAERIRSKWGRQNGRHPSMDPPHELIRCRCLLRNMFHVFGRPTFLGQGRLRFDKGEIVRNGAAPDRGQH
jgi:hypothetical protein